VARIEAARAGLGRLDALARRDSPASRLDPRTKVLATFAFVAVVASFGRLDLLRLAPLALYPLALAALGDVPARPLLVRLALASPFALGVAAFEPILDRAPAMALGSVVVSGGALALLTVLAKFLLSLSGALLLVSTTPFDEVCVALGRLGLPRALVSQLLLTYRYLFVLAEEAGRLVRAHALRSPERPRPSAGEGARLVGNLLVRSIGRAERIHAAMRCRGFEGTFPVRRSTSPGAGDLAFVAATVLLLVCARRWDLPALAGRALFGVFG